MSEIKIEKGVKVPDQHKYPFLDLKVNESFSAGTYTPELQRNLQGLGRYYGKKHKREFIARIDDAGDLRVWRIK